MPTQIVAEVPGIALGVGEPLDPVAHHQAHRARVKIGPYAFRAIFALGFQEASAVRSSASSHEIAANCADPLGPTRLSGFISRSG